MKLLAGDLPTGVASTFISPDGERTLYIVEYFPYEYTNKDYLLDY